MNDCEVMSLSTAAAAPFVRNVVASALWNLPRSTELRAPRMVLESDSFGESPCDAFFRDSRSLARCAVFKSGPLVFAIHCGGIDFRGLWGSTSCSGWSGALVACVSLPLTLSPAPRMWCLMSARGLFWGEISDAGGRVWSLCDKIAEGCSRRLLPLPLMGKPRMVSVSVTKSTSLWHIVEELEAPG